MVFFFAIRSLLKWKWAYNPIVMNHADENGLFSVHYLFLNRGSTDSSLNSVFRRSVGTCAKRRKLPLVSKNCKLVKSSTPPAPLSPFWWLFISHCKKTNKSEEDRIVAVLLMRFTLRLRRLQVQIGQCHDRENYHGGINTSSVRREKL